MTEYTFTNTQPLVYPDRGLLVSQGDVVDWDTPPVDGNWVDKTGTPYAPEVPGRSSADQTSVSGQEQNQASVPEPDREQASSAEARQASEDSSQESNGQAASAETGASQDALNEAHNSDQAQAGIGETQPEAAQSQGQKVEGV